jgi:hypothetical protein
MRVGVNVSIASLCEAHSTNGMKMWQFHRIVLMDQSLAL